MLQLVAGGVEREPLLDPSLFFKTHRSTYYDRLNESLEHLRTLNIAAELTKRARGRVFSYRHYVQLLTDEP